MQRKVNIGSFQKVTKDDYNNFGLYPRAAFDTIVGTTLIPDYAFSGFACVSNAPGTVTVGAGVLFALGKVYVDETGGGTNVDVLPNLPSVTRRIITIVAWGQEIDTDTVPRTFLTDATTRDTVATSTSTTSLRMANISKVVGDEAPDPVKPTLQANVVALAYVTVSPSGVESIVRADDNLVPTLRNSWAQISLINAWKIQVGNRLDTLASDLNALAARIFGLAPLAMVIEEAADIARLKDVTKLPSTYAAWDADHYMAINKSDTLHVDFLAHIEEGVRFPPAAITDSQLGLFNPIDPSVITTNNVLMPGWDPTLRISNVGFDAEVQIASYSFQTANMVQKTMSRTVTRYGTPFLVCTNNSWWQEGTYDPYSGIFSRAGDTFQVTDLVSTQAVDNAHKAVRITQVWLDTVNEPYWDKIVTNYSIGGSIISETFLNSQDGWLARINLFFTRVAATGDVTLMICQTTNGVPDATKVIQKVVLTQANLRVATNESRVPTVFDIPPTFLQKGRYGIIVSTPGNHYVSVLKNTNFVAGTFFYSLDGAFFQGDITTDLAFEAYFCQFRQNLTHVQLLSLSLANGIAAIDINANSFIPDGTTMTFEVQIAGVWWPLDSNVVSPATVLAGLQPLLPLRVTFNGTDSVQPALGVASNSRSRVWRPGPSMVHISTARTTPSITTITAQVRVEGWRGAPHHTFVGKILHGASFATTRTADVTSSAAALDDATAQIFKFTWTGMGALTTFKFRFEGTTDNVLATYHIAERVDVELS